MLRSDFFEAVNFEREWILARIASILRIFCLFPPLPHPLVFPFCLTTFVSFSRLIALRINQPGDTGFYGVADYLANNG